MTRVIVCGGRDFHRPSQVNMALDRMHAVKQISCVIEGGASGADHLARRWAERNGVELLTFFAEWDGQGKAAGPLRNQRMIDEGKPDGIVAFPGGRGTADMVSRAEAAGLKVWRPYGA
jgi:hypothetical protein